VLERFVFQSPAPRVVFGRGTLNAIGDELKLHGISRGFILCSGSGLEFAERIVKAAPGCALRIMRLTSSAITRQDFDAATAYIQEADANGFIGIGGGTPIGLSKSLAANTRLPWIALTTTYSGSEMASNWTYGSGKDQRAGAGQAALPATAIYDPELTLGLPPKMSGQSGMNAMAHAVESLYGVDRSPAVEAMAAEAVRLLGANLPRVVDHPNDIEARTQAFYGAWLAAAFRAQVGVEHAIAQRVRQKFGLSHAGTHAVATPYAIDFNHAHAPEAMRTIETALGVPHAGRGLYELNRRLGIPTGLKDLGMRAEDIDVAADHVAQVKIAGPRPVSRADLLELITQAYHGDTPRAF
jgi:maleylacetate reductase